MVPTSTPLSNVSSEADAQRISPGLAMTGGIPSTETLRQQALQASWRRGRGVASRRLAWRWTVWYAQKPGVWAAVLGLGLGALLWTLWQPETPLLAVTPPASAPAPVPSAPDTAWPMEPTVLIDEGGARLRWSALDSVPAAPLNPPPAPNESPLTLQLDTQLHIKEPR